MLDIGKEAYNAGMPSLHARKKRNMVREMSHQLLNTSHHEPINDEDSDKSDDVTDDDVENVQTIEFIHDPRTILSTDNFMKSNTSSSDYVTKGNVNSSHVDDDDDIGK